MPERIKEGAAVTDTLPIVSKNGLTDLHLGVDSAVGSLQLKDIKPCSQTLHAQAAFHTLSGQLAHHLSCHVHHPDCGKLHIRTDLEHVGGGVREDLDISKAGAGFRHGETTLAPSSLLFYSIVYFIPLPRIVTRLGKALR